MFDWNDLRVFLEVQRHGRLLTAARSLGVSHATVARHLEALERALGSQLLVQQASGYQLTPAGQALLALHFPPPARGPRPHQAGLRRGQQWLLAFMRSGALTPRERAEAGPRVGLGSGSRKRGQVGHE